MVRLPRLAEASGLRSGGRAATLPQAEVSYPKILIYLALYAVRAPKHITIRKIEGNDIIFEQFHKLFF